MGKVRYVMVQDEKDLKELEDFIKDNKVWTIDVETTGLELYCGNKNLGLGISATPTLNSPVPTVSYYIPLEHPQDKLGLFHNIPYKVIIEMFDRCDPAYVIGHNIKFDLHFLNDFGINFKSNCQVIDTMITAHLVDENEPSYKLEDLCQKYLGLDQAKDTPWLLKAALSVGLIQSMPNTETSTKSTIKKVMGNLDKLKVEIVCVYCLKDIDITYELFTKLDALITGKLAKVHDTAVEYNKVIFDMEKRGMLIDKAVAEEYTINFGEEISQLRDELRTHDIENPNSIQQIRRALYGKDMGSTAVEALKEMAVEYDNKVAKLMLRYRKLNTAQNSYIEPMLEKRDATSRIHPTFRITGTVSGRSSCSNPNMQSFPRGPLKKIVAAPEDWYLLEIDLNQAELRLAGHYSQCAAIINAYSNNIDLHQLTAQQVLGKENVTKDERTKAKAINFGFLYGMRAFKFRTYAKNTFDLKINQAEAQRYRDRFFDTYPELAIIKDKVVALAKANNEITMWTGRKRRYPAIINFPEGEYSYTALNGLIQGGVAEIIRIGMCRVAQVINAFFKDRVHIIMQVHDSVLMEVHKSVDDYFYQTVIDIMQDFDFRVPIIAEAKRGPSWGELAPLNLT